ncbi:MAG: ATPase, partial [Rhizobiaceae bacterium]
MNSSPDAALSQWALDREIVLSRVIDARRDLVFSVWTDPQHLPAWFGPAGFAIETKEIDISVGGLWRFDMIAPDGKRYTNRMIFRRIDPPTLGPEQLE